MAIENEHWFTAQKAEAGVITVGGLTYICEDV